jgi:hypothetical protein
MFRTDVEQVGTHILRFITLAENHVVCETTWKSYGRARDAKDGGL